MGGRIKPARISDWTKVIFEPDKELFQNTSENEKEFRKIFIDQVAENLYSDMRRARVLITLFIIESSLLPPLKHNPEVSSRSESEGSSCCCWISLSSDINNKLLKTIPELD